MLSSNRYNYNSGFAYHNTLEAQTLVKSIINSIIWPQKWYKTYFLFSERSILYIFASIYHW